MGSQVAVAASGDGIGKPSPVASRGAIAHVPGFEDGDIQLRIGLGQIVSGPQSGESCTDDRDISGAMAAQLLAWRWQSDFFPPVRDSSVEHVVFRPRIKNEWHSISFLGFSLGPGWRRN